jgi:hypothetical protein
LANRFKQLQAQIDAAIPLELFERNGMRPTSLANDELFQQHVAA